MKERINNGDKCWECGGQRAGWWKAGHKSQIAWDAVHPSSASIIKTRDLHLIEPFFTVPSTFIVMPPRFL